MAESDTTGWAVGIDVLRTEAANKKRLADSGSAKMAAQDQGENASYTKIAPQLHKQAPSH